MLNTLMHQGKMESAPKVASGRPVHMNGRVYSPETGRFLSPDPLVQAPTYSQSFNRYSYVWNNPLNNIDPSGYANIGTVHNSSQLGSDETKGNKEGEPEDAPSGYLCEQDPDNPRCVKDSPFGGTYSNCNNSAAGVACFDGRPESVSRKDGAKGRYGMLGNSLSSTPESQSGLGFQMFDESQVICSSVCVVTQFSVTASAFYFVSGEGGAIYLLDVSSGQLHVFVYRGIGLGIGLLPGGLAVTAEMGLMSQTTIGTFAGSGYSVNAIAAARAGGTVQVFGNGEDTIGFTVGAAAGIAAGISGLITTTYYQGSFGLYETDP